VAGDQGLSAGRAAAARRLREAIAAAPFMVGGTGRFDSRVMAQFGTRVCCKVGAEGVYCAALPEAGLGVALKMDDGNTARAAEVAMAALLQAFVAPRTDADAALLADLAEPLLRNWRGLAVGRLAPHESLRQAAKPASA
jgi:L-asparaginase II